MFSKSNKTTPKRRSLVFSNERMITGVISKISDHETLGFSFRDEKGNVVLGNLSARITKQTDLVSGLKVVHINGIPVETATQAATLVRSAMAGEDIAIAVDAICIKVTKKWRSDKSGVSLEANEDGVRISDVNIKGYFPMLQPGQKLVAINGVSILNIKHANTLFANNKTLSVVVVTDNEESMYSSCRSLTSYSPSSSVADELDLMEPISFQMQDFDDDEYAAQ